ncbi:MAG: Hsp20/alpha crystallin family protein [Salinisphaera sp.]|nr:Hsp20/alpha crystallin family protein [Salinisphaera sp.]
MSRELDAWMWSEAVRMLDRADRLQRQFFRPGTPRRPQWEPPVDILETADALWVVVALPGVAADALAVRADSQTLIISGERRVPAPAQGATLQRLEIPHGRFERRLKLPLDRLELAGRELRDGCLILHLRKVLS